MKKLAIFTALLMTVAANAPAEETADNITIPMQYIEIDEACRTSDMYQYNACLKQSLFEFMASELTKEQIEELKTQLDELEQEIANSEPDYDNPAMKDVKGNPEKLAAFRVESMNLIWKNILVETFNSLNAANEELQ